MKSIRHTAFAGLALLAAGGTITGNAHAAGFAIVENSAAGLGNAFAGGAAGAEDLGTAFLNPAGMTRFSGSRLQVAGHLIQPAFSFTDGGSVSVLGTPLLPGSATASDGGNGALVPNLYYVRALGSDLRLGLSVNAPFGLKTDYDGNWIGRFHAVTSDIKTINVNPSLAFRFDNGLSVGAGVSAQWIDARLTNSIDFDAVCAAVGAACLGAPGSGASEGAADITADATSWGFNAGILYEFSGSSRVGLHYRSRLEHRLDGTAEFTVPAGISALGAVNAAIAATFANDGVTSNVDLPASLSISAYHKVTPKFALMGDATWTEWSSIPELRIVFDSGFTAGGDSVEALGWEDTWRLSLGATYYHDDRWTFRTGLAYDESPTPNASLRSVRLPDNDRIWLALGAGYRYSDRVTLDAGYTHLFISDTNIGRTASSGATLIGEYESDADIVSAQVSIAFD